jgi:uncharacterized protein (TIGR02722 family)
MKIFMIVALTLILALNSCTTTRTVQRVDATQTTDLSGRWNDTDSRLVAEEMLDDALGRIWLQDFVEGKQRKPVLIVGSVKNKTHEIISSESFIKDLERELINSGRVKLVQGSDARDELRGERADQQEFASKETIKKWGREKGADFILQGVINSVVDKAGGSKAVFYQVDLELTDLETNEIGWIGTKKIKKIISN